METNTKRKTCASCAAYDETDSTCHRNPPVFLTGWEFPRTKPDDWCLMMVPTRDENGWREDWPKQDDIIGFIQSHLNGTALGALCSKFDSNPIDMRKALTWLRFDGAIRLSKGIYFANKTNPQPNPQSGPAKLTIAELLSIFPLGHINAITVLQCQRLFMESYGYTKGQFNDLRFNFMTEGKIQRDAEGKYYRPSVDDIRASKSTK